MFRTYNSPTRDNEELGNFSYKYVAESNDGAYHVNRWKNENAKVRGRSSVSIATENYVFNGNFVQASFGRSIIEKFDLAKIKLATSGSNVVALISVALVVLSILVNGGFNASILLSTFSILSIILITLYFTSKK